MKLSFRSIFQKYGKIFAQYFEQNIRSQKGIDGNAFTPSKGTLVSKSYGKKGKVKNSVSGKTGLHPRLFVTGKLSKGAFKYEASDETLRLYVNDAGHSKNVTYSDIIFYNNRPTATGNKASVSPLVFPTIEAEMNMSQPMQQLSGEITKQVEEYFRNVVGVDIKKEIKIG